MSEGEKIFLRALELNDLDLIHKWQTDDNINKLTGGNKFFISKERVKRWIEDKIHNDTKQIYCAICECQSGNMIGYASLNNIDFINRKADWGGILIGDYEARNRGFASQAATLLMRHGFFELGLQKISGKFISSHQVSIFMAKMLGFKVEGTLRREVFKNNAYHDILLMSILKEEFEIKSKVSLILLSTETIKFTRPKLSILLSPPNNLVSGSFDNIIPEVSFTSSIDL